MKNVAENIWYNAINKRTFINIYVQHIFNRTRNIHIKFMMMNVS